MAASSQTARNFSRCAPEQVCKLRRFVPLAATPLPPHSQLDFFITAFTALPTFITLLPSDCLLSQFVSLRRTEFTLLFDSDINKMKRRCHPPQGVLFVQLVGCRFSAVTPVCSIFASSVDIMVSMPSSFELARSVFWGRKLGATVSRRTLQHFRNIEIDLFVYDVQFSF
jgi:hypothetical protein